MPDHFLGYVVLQAVPGGRVLTGVVYSRTGAPIASDFGIVLSIGPVLILAGDFKTLKVTGGPASVPLTGSLIGDSGQNPARLAIQGRPSRA